MSADPTPAFSSPVRSPVRSALLRGALVGAATCALTCVAVIAFVGAPDGMLVFALFSAGVGLASAPAAWLEARLAPAGWPRAIAAACAGAVLAFVVAVLAILQALYAKGALAGDPARGLQEATDAVERLARWKTVEMLAPLGLPVALTTLARVRGLRPLAHGVVSLLLGLALVAYFQGTGGARQERDLFGAIALVLALVLPPAAWLGDPLERRLWPAAPP